ncbi:endonuclease/exonuclease/phosphatase family protein [Echinimonas agarilytica]|uniref:Endonuclease/exonuclease/phosphatase family protein n=1 Tax=Echinimonas agarilytica TaxID=1215918 RepID=A0AA41W782_9GAMM|nr:endonuclease/exonuclease/phosphatase family protein [Echinimonas agarilytica]MCM2679926.1 endonuclease/exonuclease/phosphatase family protein [Echinimonas agarilytica]
MAIEIKFASFNLYNFQKPGEKVYKKVVQPSDYKKKRRWTREMLLNMNADVIAFQELWSPDCLVDTFDIPELSHYQLHFIKPSWYNIAVAVAVKAPWVVSDKKVIKAFPFKKMVKVDDGDGEDDQLELSIKSFSRSLLKLKIHHSERPDVPTTTVFAAHLKSKLPAQVGQVNAKHRKSMGSAISTIRRTAEAAALRWLLTNHLKGTHKPTVLIGDLNDDPRSNTLALITEQPNLSMTAKGSDSSLYSALQMQQLQSYRDVFYTHEFNRMKDTLDHILVSEEFFVNSKDSHWQHKHTQVWNDHLEDNQAHTGDHGIICASFRYKPNA